MNNTTNSWEEKDPEPISAQIEGLDDIYREYIDEMYVEAGAELISFEEIKDALNKLTL
jgi:hypothetical protein